MVRCDAHRESAVARKVGPDDRQMTRKRQTHNNSRNSKLNIHGSLHGYGLFGGASVD